MSPLPIIARCTLGLLALSAAQDALAQVSPRFVPRSRADQLPQHRRVRHSPRFVQPRNPHAPIAPFTLTAVKVEGSTLPPAELRAAWAPFVGQRIDNDGLAKITNAVGAVYVRSPIALSTVYVPEQDFANGVLRLIAVEGYIGAVEITAKVSPRRRALLKAYAERLAAERPLTKRTLQRVTGLMQDLPGFTPELSYEQESAPGAQTLVVDGADRRFQVGLDISNRGIALLGHTQVQATVYANTLFTGSDQLRASVEVPTDPKRFQYLTLAYATDLDADGTSIAVNAAYLRTRPQLFALKGEAFLFGAQVSRQLVRSDREALVATLGFDGINGNNALFGRVETSDRVRAFRVSLAYSRTSSGNYASVGVTSSSGLDILGARTDPRLSDPSFRKVDFRVTDYLSLAPEVTLRLNGFAQMTRDFLPTSELIALGGDEFGRAYEASLIAGDYGYAGSAELAWSPKKLPKPFAGSEAYIFTDGGRVWFRNRLGGPAFENHLASVGGGVRAKIGPGLVVQAEAVRGLYNPVNFEDREKWRLIAGLHALF